jgi:hypothetical protein
MTSITPNLAASAIGRADAHDPAAAAAADSGPFVLNLTSSTTPMALAHPDLAELKRFTFFVSRRFEEGRERFRLHMGYFTTLAEAEEWLAVVREIYPGAWAGEAPGKKLRARAAAAAAEQAQHAIGPQPRSALPDLSAATTNPTPAPRAPAPAPTARPVQQAAPAAVPVARPVESHPTPARTFEAPGMMVPTVHAAAPPPGLTPPVLTPPVAKPAPVQALAPSAKAPSAPTAVPVARAAPVAAPAPAARAPGVVGTAQSRLAPVAGVPTVAAAKKAAPTAPAPSTPPRAPAAAVPARLAAAAKASPPSAHSAKQRPGAKPSSPGAKPSKGSAFDDSNVREVLAALDDTGETGQTRMMPAPHLARVDAQDDSSLTDTQVLRYLETRREDGGRAGDDSPDASISLLKPDDTGTRRALKDAVTQNAPVSFAVQLQWAVQPVELDKVPPLAIFSAYTLYTVEGSREGRKWYGLRLGFFSDAISAKQVAYYVRSEFASVAVVPVSPQEKVRATEEDSKKANSALAFPRKTRQGPVDEFKLIDSDQVPQSTTSIASKPITAKPVAAAVAKAAAKPAAAAPAAAPKRAMIAKGGGRVGARERRGPQTLEETLEILGAGELEVDNGRGETVNDTGVRHLRVEVQKNTPFSRLLERLSERTKKN